MEQRKNCIHSLTDILINDLESQSEGLTRVYIPQHTKHTKSNFFKLLHKHPLASILYIFHKFALFFAPLTFPLIRISKGV